VTEEGYQSVMGDSDSLKSALAENRLFLLDYKELQALVDNPGEYNGMPKQLFAPLALFARPVSEDELVPVAIQRTQTANAPSIVYATEDESSSNYWPWQTAKSIVQAADGNYHELFVHLARTHLMMEAFTVATHRNLATEHPLNVLLMPHFEGTLFINNTAAKGLISAGSPVDHIFAAVITQSQASSGADRLEYDFYENMLPDNLKERCINDTAILPYYPYRDDALLVWNAIQEWAKEYIDIYYANDDAVAGDTELAAWAAELMNDGKVKGFTQVKTKDQLVQVLTMIIFTGSAQHASVNFPQSSIMTYMPAISGAIWGSENPTGANEEDWLATLPPIGLAPEQLDLLHLLGGIYYRMLGDYRSNDFPYLEWFGDRRVIGKGHALDRFQQSLKIVEAEINQRNTKRKIPYTYLLPSKIPMSINI
jgi:arachidonate 15-lipoxygenase